MVDHTATRTLVKSTPELWAECSDAASLARHLGAFGEIRVTRLEPETTVAWEGDAASGTVSLEPSGWGTRVTLTAVTEAEPRPDAVVPAAPRPRGIARLLTALPRRRRRRAEGEAKAEAESPLPTDADGAPQALAAALDSLGRAHHRPYSRA